MAPRTPDAARQMSEMNEQSTDRAESAIGNYFSWLQNLMSANPWINVELNKKFLSYATETANAYAELPQRLSQAKNAEDAVKIQTEFVKEQMESFNNRARELGEIYTKMASTGAMRPFGMST